MSSTCRMSSGSLLLQIDVNGQNQEVHRAFLAGNTAFIFTNSSECPAHAVTSMRHTFCMPLCCCRLAAPAVLHYPQLRVWLQPHPC